MNNFIKPNLLISSCFFDSCRYDGEMINDEFIKSLQSYVTYKKICPEVSIGLGIPRKTIRLVKDENEEIRLKESKTERDLTIDMSKFAYQYVISLNNIHGFIFKGKSPSCGYKDAKLYKSNKYVKKVNGMFTDIVVKHYPNNPIIDDGRLNDYNIREHFLSRIYMLANFDYIYENKSIKLIQDYHHTNKLLLMSMNQQGLKKLGRIIGNARNNELDEVFSLYRKTLLEITSRMANIRSKINVLLHTFGQVSAHLLSKEKQFVLDTFDKYRKGQIPSSSPMYVLKTYAIKYDKYDLLNQSFFNPFPEDLLQVRDSGKIII